MSQSERSWIGPYQVVRLLGRGGMGEVYLTQDPRLSRFVAVKVLSNQALQSEEGRRRFEREAKTAAQMAHPHIVHIYEVGEVDGLAFLAMEYVEGRTLRELIQEGPMAAPRLVELAMGMAEGICAAHERGIIHRDIKPANILVDRDGRPRLLDFGLAKALDVALEDPAAEDERSTISHITKTRKVMGTVAYMSPEQASGKELDARSDIFSFGIVLYQMATGVLPFEGDSDITTLVAILRDPPQGFSALGIRAPQELERIILRCLEKRPQDRYQTMRDLLEDLRRLRARGLQATQELKLSGAWTARVGSRRSARRQVLATSLLILSAALLAGGGSFWMGVGPWSRQGTSSLDSLEIRVNPEPILNSDPILPVPPKAPEPVSAREEINVLAILGFRNLTSEPDYDWITSGLSEILIDDLGRMKNLRLVGTHKLSDLAAREGASWENGLPPRLGGKIAQAAGANLILTGSLLRKDDQFLLTVRLEDIRRGTVLFSQGQLGEDIYQLSSQVAEGIRMQLEPEASAPEEVAGEGASNEAMSLFSKAVTEIHRMESSKAIPLLVQSIAKNPEFLSARLKLAQCYLHEGKSALAREQVDFLQSRKNRLRQEQGYLVQLYDGQLRNEVGQVLQAVDALKPYGAEDPEIGSLVFRVEAQVGQLSQDRARQKKGLDGLRQVYLQDKQFAPVVISYARALQQAGQREESIDLLGQYVEARPDDARMRTFYASALQEGNHLQSAVAQLALAWIQDPKDWIVLSSLVDVTRRLQDFKGAERWLQELGQLRSGDMSGPSAFQEICLQGARGHIGQMLQITESSVEQALARGDQGVAMHLADRTAGLLLALDRSQEAWQLFEKLPSFVKEEGWPLVIHVIFARASGQASLAAELELKARRWMDGAGADLKPFCELQLDLGRLTSEDAFEQASQKAEKLQVATPGSLYFPLIRLALRLNKFEWLARYLKAGIDKLSDPSEPCRIYAHYFLGRCAEALGRPEEARAAYREFLKWWGEGDPSVTEIAEARTRLAKLEGAKGAVQ